MADGFLKAATAPIGDYIHKISTNLGFVSGEKSINNSHSFA